MVWLHGIIRNLIIRLIHGTGWLLGIQPLCLDSRQEAGRKGNGQKGPLPTAWPPLKALAQKSHVYMSLVRIYSHATQIYYGGAAILFLTGRIDA